MQWRPTHSAQFSGQDRPDGEVIWGHATNTERLLALCDLANRLKTQRPDLRMITTWELHVSPLPPLAQMDLPLGPLPEDSSSEARMFLERWRPDLCIWAGGSLRRMLMRHMRETRTPALLVDIEEAELPSRARVGYRISGFGCSTVSLKSSHHLRPWKCISPAQVFRRIKSP